MAGFRIMKVLVADKISASGVAFLRAQPELNVVEAYGSSPSRLCELAADVDAIIVRSASSITADIIAAAPKLKVIGRAGVGVDNIDVSAASDRGVIVLNTPSGNTIATAELTFTHLLCTARPIPQAHGSMKAGNWEKKAFEGAELFGKKLGVLGLGRIGTEVARRALAFQMEVLAYDPYLTEARAEQLGVRKTDLDTVLREVDFLTVHMPKTAETTNMIDGPALAKMKKGVRIVNCARGGLIDEQALADALASGKVAAAGLDVFVDEPLSTTSPLRAHDRITLTPHLGASTAEAQENVGLEVAECIVDVLHGGIVRNAVNAPSVDPALLKTLRPFLVLAHHMGLFLQQMVEGPVSTIRMVYSGKLADLDVKPLTRAFQRGYLRRIATDVNDVNAPRVMERLGIRGEIIQNNLERDYTELIRAEALDASGHRITCIEGTGIGKSQSPRLTSINDRDIEVALDEKYLLVLENEDVPGIVGMVGTVLAEHKLNISNMSLSRRQGQGLALNVCGLDSAASPAVLAQIRSHPHVRNLHLVNLTAD
jgi:D-3-phosphoglycerate dehydrogenase / 2-oxoglutarate reductase